jgi:hypothetical protein
VGALPGQVCGETLDLRRTGMRRVGAWELVSLDGVMESPEEWAFSYSNDEIDPVAEGGGLDDRRGVLGVRTCIEVALGVG